MPKYEVNVWQTCEVQWGYTVEASNAEEARKKVEDGDYEEGPTMLDTQANEGNDWDTVEVFEV